MVKHIVFFKLSPSITSQNRESQLKKLDAIFSPLAVKLPYIVEYRTGINFTEADHNWDFAIDSVFRTKDELFRYQESAQHKKAVRMGSVIEKEKAVVDYEF
jgi:hypothetical protein